MAEGDMAPHGVIIHIKYDVHALQPDGMYSPIRREGGERIIELRGDDKALCMAKLRDFLDNVAGEHHDERKSRIKTGLAGPIDQEAGPGQSQVRGPGGALPPPPKVLGMRGGFAGRDGH